MRTLILGLTLAASGIAAPAGATTIVIYAEPMTMERRVVVLDSVGPDRAYLCMLPPAVTGCHKLPLKRSSR